ncbi:Adaptin C-terminal domain [Nakaseomyces glabratus]|nr:Adaptin C-terminal domain [Nakaseomyces glabratus]KAH7584553.1 Adaptin C-terminal domain [Nakaseomyces glabratus]
MMRRSSSKKGSSGTYNGSSSLRNFIKDVRNAKTLADERAIINKQAAKIRTKLRDDHLSSDKKRNNIIKLLYLYILGERTHFGQVECINLIASDQYIDKRLGYLSTTLLLDESQDLLTLLTNLINNDLKHPNKYVVSLALTALGFLSSPELARDLYPDVEGLLKTYSTDPYILKKALQCCAKLIAKDSQLLEIVPIDLFLTLLKEYRSSLASLSAAHGVLIGLSRLFQAIATAITNLVTPQETSESDPEDMAYRQNLAQQMIKIFSESSFLDDFYQVLASLSSRNLDPQFDVQGVSDPFLQCEVITTLRLYFKAYHKLATEINQEQVDGFNDLLTNIATNTDSTKSSGQAVLYEITRTIFDLQLPKPLQVLGINILGNFLSPRSVGGKKPTTAVITAQNNTKYVALNMLLKVVPSEPEAVRRHRKFISRCLNDQDISIRMRALELTFAIMDKDNLVELINEVLNFLAKSVMNNGSAKGGYSSSYKINSFGEDIDDSKDLIIFAVNHIVDKFGEISEEQGENIDNNWRLSVFVKILKLVGSYIPVDRISDILIAFNNTLEVNYKTDVIIRMLDISLREVMESTDKTTEDEFIEEGNLGWQLVSIWCIGEYGDIVLQALQSDSKLNETYGKTINEKTIVNYLKLKDTQYIRTNLKINHYVLTAALKLSVRIQDFALIEKLRQIIVGQTKNTDLLLQAKATQYEIIFSQPESIRKQILDAMPQFERAVKTEKPVTSISHLDNGKQSDRKHDPLLDLLGDTDVQDTKQQQKNNTNLLADLLLGENNNGIQSQGPTSKNNEDKLTLPESCTLLQTIDCLEIYASKITKDDTSAHLEIYYKNNGDVEVSNLQCLVAVTKTLKVVLGQLYPSVNIPANGIIKQTLKVSGTGNLKMRVKLSYSVGGSQQTQQFDHKFPELTL